MSNLVINKDFFIGRATKIYEAWNTDAELSNVDALVFAVNHEKEPSYSKSNSLQTWLFNCSLMDTLMVITKSGIYFLGSEKKVQFFSPLETKDKENLHPNVPPFVTFKRNKVDNDRANFEKILGIISKGNTVGRFVKDKPATDFTKAWESSLTEKGLNIVDVSLSFAKLFAVKNADEIEIMKKSASASVNTWNYLRKKIFEIVNQDKKVRHNKLAADLVDIMGKVQVQGNLANGNMIDDCYTPIIQSGEATSLKFSAESNERILHCGFITSCIGARLASYCSNVGRTMMVLPSEGNKLMEGLHESLISAEVAVMNALKPGAKICDAYEAGINSFKESQPDYVQYLVKQNFGFATGIEFREGHLLINDKCKQIVEENMTFIIAMGLQNFPKKPTSKDSTKSASIFISDTILVSPSGPNEMLTSKAKNFRSNIMKLKEEDQEADVVEEIPTEGRSKRSVVLQEQTRHKQTNEEKRQEKQRELAEQINREARERMALQKGGDGVQKKVKSNISYKSEEKFPDDEEVGKLMIHVDKRHDTVILPIFGIPVPFHISMIKNVSQVSEGDYFCIRINFTHPGSQIGKDNINYPNPLAKFLKEVSYKSTSVREQGQSNAPSTNLSTALRLIKEMQKRFRTLEAEEREKEGAVKQDKLILASGKANPKLKDLYVRPNIIAKRISGSLEAHVNGFRYTSLRGDKIDVLYNNIKHAFFQPCDNEMIILLHFHLKNPVLWGKKKYGDVQFYAEVGEITTDLGKYHHMQDRDDIQSEQMEREMRKKLNMAFQNFCDKVVRLTNEAVDFDMPFAELAFTGVPFRSAVSMKPTSTCLVHLTEWPPFVITLDEVELVHFERVTSNTRTFDMIIVFKDYRRKVQQIGQIPSASLDNVKDWLNSCDIRYSEGAISLNWPTIMKTIMDDPTEFFENGGWGFLHDESGEEDGEEESESSEFEVSSDDDDDSASDEDEEEESAASSDESASEASLGSDESSGKDWSDLEEEASKADRAKERGEIEQERHHHHSNNNNRKRKGGGASAPSSSSKRRR